MQDLGRLLKAAGPLLGHLRRDRTSAAVSTLSVTPPRCFWASLGPRVLSVRLPCSRRWSWCLASGILLGTCLGNLPAAVFGQTAHPAAWERQDSALSTTKREELYRQLRAQAEVLEAQARVVKTVAKLVGPTVVHVEASTISPRRSKLGERTPVEEAGSGVIVQLDQRYYVLTNRHVIGDSSREDIRIRLADGRQLQPRETWVDRDTDVGIMSIAAPDLVAAPLGDSDQLDIGDYVLAVGSPFGLRQSVTSGIISAKRRHDLPFEVTSGGAKIATQNFLQTDAAINPGNSGGPLINLRGEVIGINTAIASNSGGSEGIGFAIPINMFMFFARQMLAHGKVTPAYLGVTLDPSFNWVAAAELGLPRVIGARVQRLEDGSPAATANLQIGDVIVQYNDTPVEDDAHLVSLIRTTEVGTEVALTVFRDHQPQTVRVRLASHTNTVAAVPK